MFILIFTKTSHWDQIGKRLEVSQLVKDQEGFWYCVDFLVHFSQHRISGTSWPRCSSCSLYALIYLLTNLWATRPNRRAFFAHKFLLSMCPIVILKEPILFKVFWFLATNIIKGQSAGGFSLHLEVRSILNVSPNFYNTTYISVPTRKMVPIHK